MNHPLRIAIAEDEPELLADLEETLSEFGHHVVATAKTGTELVEYCRELNPDLVITDIKMPDLDGLEAASQICRIRPTPVVVLSAYHDQEYIDRTLKEYVLAYLVKPLSDQSLKTSIALAMQRFKEFEALQKQVADVKQALEDRKIVERAKGVLMKRAGLSSGFALFEST